MPRLLRRLNLRAMKVLVIDDHPIVRDGLAATVARHSPDAIALHAGDGATALALIAEHGDLDAVFLDLNLPDMTGLEALAEIGRVRPECPVIVISASEEPNDARQALAQGAMGYVPKSAGPQTLLSALTLVLNGDLYVPPLVLTEPPVRPVPARVHSRRNLTDRQVDVLRGLASGQANKVIALDLGLSEKTVKAHVTAIFRELDVESRTQAIAAARSLGLI